MEHCDMLKHAHQMSTLSLVPFMECASKVKASPPVSLEATSSMHRAQTTNAIFLVGGARARAKDNGPN
eukprot:scaffold274338_cov15-Prasinocladus_malaysianus.AAC.1